MKNEFDGIWIISEDYPTIDHGAGGCDEEIPLADAGFNTLTWGLMGVDIA